MTETCNLCYEAEIYNLCYEEVAARPTWRNRDFNAKFDAAVDKLYFNFLNR